MNADFAPCAFIERDFVRQCAFLAELVRTPSDNPPGDCAPLAVRTAALLGELGLAVEIHPVPAQAVQAAGMRSATNLIVRQHFSTGGPCVALNAHGDVVPPGLGWTQDPYGAAIVEDARHGSCMYGRGVAVSKSDFATYTWALLALRQWPEAARRLAGSLELHFTFDEETGGDIGPRWLLAQGLSRPDHAICAGFAHAVTTAHNGCLHLEVTVRGRQAHAAMPQTGIDALAACVPILQRLYALRESLANRHSHVPGIDHPTLNIGLIEGGINTNVVPDRVSFRLDRRIIPEEDAAAVETELRAQIEAAAHTPGIELSIRRLLLAQPLMMLPGAERLTRLLQRHGEAVFGEPIPAHGVPLYTDARHYAAAGIPTVLYGAGPHTLAQAHAHAADEHLRLSDLRGATQVVTAALAELLQAD